MPYCVLDRRVASPELARGQKIVAYFPIALPGIQSGWPFISHADLAASQGP